MEDNDEIKESMGVVLLLDALGVRQFGLDDSTFFLKNLAQFLKTQKNLKESKLNQFEGRYGIKGQIQVRSFGDTILLFWETGNTSEEIQGGLVFLSSWLRASIFSGMLSRIMWRGAFTVGGFVYNKDSVIGPAIADVAGWYESADWGGIIATPRCGLYLEQLNGDNKRRQASSNVPIWDIDKNYIKYNVPFKNGYQSFWCVAWPAQFFLEVACTENECFEKVELFYKLIGQFDIPRGAESKYQNTEKFFLDYIEKYVKPKIK